MQGSSDQSHFARTAVHAYLLCFQCSVMKDEANVLECKIVTDDYTPFHIDITAHV